MENFTNEELQTQFGDFDLFIAKNLIAKRKKPAGETNNIVKIWVMITKVKRNIRLDKEEITFLSHHPARHNFFVTLFNINNNVKNEVDFDFKSKDYKVIYNIEDSKEQKVEKFENKYETITLKSRNSRKKTITALMSTKKNGVEYKINFIATAKTIGACKTLIVKYINEKIHKNGYKKITIEAKYDGILSTKFSEVDEFSSPIRKAWKN